ncbi:putative ABC transporter permease [uncultured Subdoligranulum sp.]|uniref:putative ABC transporter permease n=1 Tax=uncultured Subdoligranulum sp. TaxID=512298 RepID=UPI0025CD1F7A|nr:putative ABC transporter permease [uncultured Subdoligranulum sp.]
MPPIESVIRTLFWFFLYSILGWCVEVIYAALKEHRLVNRGFLCGPLCPIYGIGMLVLLHCMRQFAARGSTPGVLTVFVVGMVLTTLLELIGGWVLFKLYRIRWWDYSHLKWNLGGYICPQFSLLWGLGSVIMVKVVHPLLLRSAGAVPLRIMAPLDAVFLVFFLVDVGASTAAAIGLNQRLQEIDELRAKLRISSDKLTELLGTGAMTADTLLDEQKLQLALAKLESRDNAAELRAELTVRADLLRAKLRAIDLDKLGTRRLLRAFPRMQSLRYGETLASTRAALVHLRKLAGNARQAARQAASNAADKLRRPEE